MRGMPGARHWSLAAVVLLLSMTAHPRALLAQQVFGTVLDSASQQPLPGTVILILDAQGRPAARGTTDALGKFRLSPWSGRTGGRAARSMANLRLRVLRMGFRPRELPLAGAATSGALEIGLVSFPVSLEEVQVTAATCPRRPDRAPALALLNQVRSALYTSVLARSRNSATMTRLLYERQFDGERDGIVRQAVKSKVTSATSEPFSAARSAAQFDRQGFRKDSDGFHTYLGPDAETLVTDAFAERYCFRLIAPDRGRPRQAGLGFEPVERVDGRIDIVGTVWIDTLSRVLHDLTFRYVGLDRETSTLVPEGRLSFRELSNGVVLIDQWSLRLLGHGGDEIGGEIARASWPDGFSWKAPLGALRLRVVTGQGQPAAGSVVQLVNTDYRATANADGIVELNDLLPGPYTASIRDPRIAALDLSSAGSMRFTAIRDSTIVARAEVETADELVGKRCGNDMRVAGRALVLGRVVTPDGRPVKDATFTIRDEFGSPLVEGGRVDEDGLFHWCQAPLGRRITIDVLRGDRRANASQLVSDQLTALRLIMP